MRTLPAWESHWPSVWELAMRVAVGVGVRVAVGVGVCVAVGVGVAVAGGVGVLVGVRLGVPVGVELGVPLAVAVGVGLGALEVTGTHAENSDVLPAGSVAVAVITCPSSTLTGKVTVIGAVQRPPSCYVG